ncbi:DUF3352 domain-containing protein [Phormidesmis priestleyi]
MKLRSFFYLLATIAAGLLLTGTIGFVWLFAQSPLGLLKGGPETNPSAVMFVSRQAPLMASLMVNPDRLESLRLVTAKPQDRKQARSQWTQFQQSILGASGLDYARDIKPWLGNEMTLAVTTLDFDRDPDNGQQPGYLLAVTTKDAERSREFLQVLWQKRALAGTDLVFEQYKGTKLIYDRDLEEAKQNVTQTSTLTQTSSSQKNSPHTSHLTPHTSFASAVVGNRFVLFANRPKVLRDAVNTVQAIELGLGSSAEYQKAIAHLNQGRIGVAFLNFPQLSTWTGRTVNDATGKYENLAIALGVDRQGLIAETALQTDEQETRSLGVTRKGSAALSQPVGALQYIPAISPFSASGQDLAQLWADLSQGVSGYPDVANWANQPIDALQRRWKLNLPEDIFSWVKGEYALGWVPREVTSPEETRLNWVFVADKSTSQAEEAIAHLDNIAKQQGVSVGSLQLDDQTVNVWTRLSTLESTQAGQKAVEAKVAGVHASVGNYEIFAPSVEVMSDLLNSTKNPITKTKSFEDAIAPFSKPNNGYLFVDWQKAQPILEARFPFVKLVRLAGQPFLDHLRSLTLSNYGSESGVQRGSIFVKLE